MGAFLSTLFATSPLLLSLIALTLSAGLYIGYKKALPKPIPGIPYNAHATKAILGDLPSMLSHLSSTKQLFTWMTAQNVALKSPITQVFTRPFAAPWVILTDYRESQDICLRRTREFDRSNFFGDMFVGVMPDHHIGMPSALPTFKGNRNLVNYLMTPTFLNKVAAPEIYSSVSTVLDFWRLKSKLAQRRPFTADHDIFNGALDIIFAACFGLDRDDNCIIAQTSFLASQASTLQIPTSVDEPIVFPSIPLPERFEAVVVLTESLETSIKSPVPRIAHTAIRQMPYMKRAFKTKEEMVRKEIAKAVEALDNGVEPVSACEEIISRETIQAKKEERKPDYYRREVQDEVFGFLLAGHDTTSSTVVWGVKYLADNPIAQTKLRNTLRAAYPSAASERRNPTVHEINSIPVPYLDAVIEEIFRLSKTVSVVIRKALVDTTVLGHAIPKGTDVFMMNMGSDFLSPSFDVAPADRSAGARASKVGMWETEDMLNFRPERWIREGEKGEEVFDALAGPMFLFGAGPRGCYGKRLAYLQLRIMVVLFLWNFVFEECPEELSSYVYIEKLTGQPKQCFVRLSEVVW